MTKENKFDKLNSADVEIDKKEPVRKDRRDGKKKWLVLCLILVSSVRKIKKI